MFVSVYFLLLKGFSGINNNNCSAQRRWFEPNPRIKAWALAHCLPSSKWVPGGSSGEVEGGEERNWPPYLIMPTAQDN